MALRLRLRGALSLSSSLLHHHPLHQPQPISSHLLSTPTSHTPAPSPTKLARPFTSTTTLFRKTFDPQTDEIAPDTILFEGCDYNHWLITVDFPRDANISREQMIETYVDTAAQVFGRSRNPTRCSFPFCLYWSSLDFLYTSGDTCKFTLMALECVKVYGFSFYFSFYFHFLVREWNKSAYFLNCPY